MRFSSWICGGCKKGGAGGTIREGELGNGVVVKGEGGGMVLSFQVKYVVSD